MSRATALTRLETLVNRPMARTASVEKAARPTAVCQEAPLPHPFSSSFSRPARVRTVLTAGLALALLTMVALSPYAHAAGDDPLSSGTPPCKPKGHAYYIDVPGAFTGKPGFNYMSGFENDKRYGIPVVPVVRFQGFQLAGNGIKPGTSIQFFESSGVMGGQSFITSPAGRNCVVNQRDNQNLGFIGNVPPGKYKVFATYEVPSKKIIKEPVVILQVLN